MSRTVRICASAPSLLASVSDSEVLGCGESPCRSQWDFDGHVVFLTHNSFECVSQFLLFSALSRALGHIPNAFALAQDIELEKKRVAW